ncbi:MAG: hypothetical protein VB061_09380 [Christensenella sp.]|nr:hypothetical protein [Christensenella sp.]
MPTSRRDELNQYYQDLLVAQFKASGNISHAPSKGTVRENFVKDVIRKMKGNELKLYRGVFECGDEWQSNEADFIWQNRGCESEFGTYNLHECRMMMEIKSCATGNELKKLNQQAQHLKERHENRKRFSVGMFCYSTELKRDTVLERFGHPFDRAIQSSATYYNRYDIYDNIDFLFSLDQTNENAPEPYFIYRNKDNTLLFVDPPIIYHFLLMFNEMD